jgi:hypothetical protein
MTPDSAAGIIAISKMLRAGFGVDDIALKHGFQPDHVRLVVDMFRREGLLDKWFKRKRRK